MNAERLDVLAVMHDCAIALANEDACGHAAELTDARAAVAELIEAAKLSNKAHRLNARSDGTERGDVAASLGLDRFADLDAIRVAARDNLTAALARIGAKP